MSDPKIFIAAGEASGDQHAARLVSALRARRPEWRFVGMGGPKLEAAGVELREDLVERSVMGFLPVLASLGGIFETVARFVEELRRDPPDLLVIVDNPGLNLNLARLARSRGIPVVSYICPQVWAWAPWRIRRVARRSDLLLVIVPFEEELYHAVHPRVRYVGNPVFDHLAAVEPDREIGQGALPPLPPGARPLALLPGSRRQEIREVLPRNFGSPPLCVRGTRVSPLWSPANAPRSSPGSKQRSRLPDSRHRSWSGGRTRCSARRSSR